MRAVVIAAHGVSQLKFTQTQFAITIAVGHERWFAPAPCTQLLLVKNAIAVAVVPIEITFRFALVFLCDRDGKFFRSGTKARDGNRFFIFHTEAQHERLDFNCLGLRSAVGPGTVTAGCSTGSRLLDRLAESVNLDRFTGHDLGVIGLHPLENEARWTLLLFRVQNPVPVAIESAEKIGGTATKTSTTALVTTAATAKATTAALVATATTAKATTAASLVTITASTILCRDAQRHTRKAEGHDENKAEVQMTNGHG